MWLNNKLDKEKTTKRTIDITTHKMQDNNNNTSPITNNTHNHNTTDNSNQTKMPHENSHKIPNYLLIILILTMLTQPLSTRPLLAKSVTGAIFQQTGYISNIDKYETYQGWIRLPTITDLPNTDHQLSMLEQLIFLTNTDQLSNCQNIKHYNFKDIYGNITIHTKFSIIKNRTQHSIDQFRTFINTLTKLPNLVNNRTSRSTFNTTYNSKPRQTRAVDIEDILSLAGKVIFTTAAGQYSPKNIIETVDSIGKIFSKIQKSSNRQKLGMTSTMNALLAKKPSQLELIQQSSKETIIQTNQIRNKYISERINNHSNSLFITQFQNYLNTLENYIPGTSNCNQALANKIAIAQLRTYLHNDILETMQEYDRLRINLITFQNALSDATLALNQGQLPIALYPPHVLQKIIDQTSPTHKPTIGKNIVTYYGHKLVRDAKLTEKGLFFNFVIPYSKINQAMILWKLTTIPIQVQNEYIEPQTYWKYIAKAEGNKMYVWTEDDIKKCSRDDDTYICSGNIAISDNTDCHYALFSNNEALAGTICNYKKSEKPPNRVHITKISQNTYHLWNTQGSYLNLEPLQSTIQNQQCKTCIVELPCGSQLTIDEDYLISADPEICSNQNQIQITELNPPTLIKGLGDYLHSIENPPGIMQLIPVIQDKNRKNPVTESDIDIYKRKVHNLYVNALTNKFPDHPEASPPMSTEQKTIITLCILQAVTTILIAYQKIQNTTQWIKTKIQSKSNSNNGINPINKLKRTKSRPGEKQLQTSSKS